MTGTFGYAGKYIAGRLLDRGLRVITLTNSLNRKNPFEGRIKAYHYNFDNPDKLRESLEGVRVLCNIYWVRFNSRTFTFVSALKESGLSYAILRPVLLFGTESILINNIA